MLGLVGWYILKYSVYSRYKWAGSKLVLLALVETFYQFYVKPRIKCDGDGDGGRAYGCAMGRTLPPGLILVLSGHLGTKV